MALIGPEATSCSSRNNVKRWKGETNCLKCNTFTASFCPQVNAMSCVPTALQITVDENASLFFGKMEMVDIPKRKRLRNWTYLTPWPDTNWLDQCVLFWISVHLCGIVLFFFFTPKGLSELPQLSKWINLGEFEKCKLTKKNTAVEHSPLRPSKFLWNTQKAPPLRLAGFHRKEQATKGSNDQEAPSRQRRALNVEFSLPSIAEYFIAAVWT